MHTYLGSFFGPGGY